MLAEDRDLDLWNVLVGEVVGPHGINGELKVRPTTDNEHRFDSGNFLCLVDATGQRRLTRIESSRPFKGCILLRLAECRDRTEAESLRSTRLCIMEKMMAPLPEGCYYVKDLIGMEVVTTQDEVVGRVEDVLETGSNAVYVTTGGLIPATKEVVQSIDLQSRRIVIRLTQGLLDR